MKAGGAVWTEALQGMLMTNGKAVATDVTQTVPLLPGGFDHSDRDFCRTSSHGGWMCNILGQGKRWPAAFAKDLNKPYNYQQN